LGFVLLAVVLAFGLVVAGCGPKPEPDAKWTLEQKGGVTGEDGVATADSTHIVVKFDKAVESFPTDAVTVSDDFAEKSGAPVKGDGNNWEIPITVNKAGEATVKIDGLDGVESGSKTVGVLQKGSAPPVVTPVNPGGDNGGDTTPTTPFDSVIKATLGGTATNTNNATQQGWLINEKMDEIKASKYFVIATTGEGDNKDGFGGIQIIYQGNNGESDPNAIDWTSRDIIPASGSGNYLSYPRSVNKTAYIVIDLEELFGSDDITECTGWARILIGYYGGSSAFEGLGITNAYFIGDFIKPEGAVNLKDSFGYVFSVNK